MNVFQRGLADLGVVHSERTPVESATATFTADGECLVGVDARRVVEAGSSALNELAAAGE